MKIKNLIQKIESHYRHHGVRVKLILVSTLREYERFIFRFKIKQGTKVDTIYICSPDIKTALQMPLFQPFRIGEVIYLAVSKKNVLQNSLSKMLTSSVFQKSKALFPIALGYDMAGRMIFDDLAEMVHVIYAGSTNSGKSSGLICVVLSLIVKQPVEKVNLVLFDVGANTLGLFDGVPHLSCPIVKDIRTGTHVIKMLVQEMDRRIKLDNVEMQKQPAIIVIMDEYTSFIDKIGSRKQTDEVTNAISNILRRGRHAKIYMVFSA